MGCSEAGTLASELARLSEEVRGGLTRVWRTGCLRLEPVTPSGAGGFAVFMVWDVGKDGALGGEASRGFEAVVREAERRRTREGEAGKGSIGLSLVSCRLPGSCCAQKSNLKGCGE